MIIGKETLLALLGDGLSHGDYEHRVIVTNCERATNSNSGGFPIGEQYILTVGPAWNAIKDVPELQK
jgi:hypothetical protein